MAERDRSEANRQVALGMAGFVLAFLSLTKPGPGERWDLLAQINTAVGAVAFVSFLAAFLLFDASATAPEGAKPINRRALWAFRVGLLLMLALPTGILWAAFGGFGALGYGTLVVVAAIWYWRSV